MFGKFFYNWNSFWKVSTSPKAFNLASLALAIGLSLIKLIPLIKEKFLKKVFFKDEINIYISTLLNVLNMQLC